MKRKLVTAILVLAICGAATAEPVTPDRVRVGAELMSTLVVTKVAPIYPAEAKQAHVQGTVTLRVEISKAGDVEYVKLISGHPMLAPAAIEAVKHWKYKPYLLNGEAVKVETTVTVNFTLADEPQTGVVGSVPGNSVAGKGGVNSVVIPVDPGKPGRAAVPQRARVSQNVAEGLLIHKVQPEHPGDAARIQGKVLLSATIDKEGNVANLRLISGHPMLAPAAIEAVRQWKFRPYLLNGEAVEIETTVAVNFDLLK
jgi:TonB family protein